jgi:lipopolysaccharide assembly outer membrane protein LptD (OstA)
LEFVRINFDQSLNVNTKSQEMTVTGNVRTLYAPVTTFDDVYSPDENAQLPRGSVKLNCHQIETTKWTPQATGAPTTELIATGNARFQSDTMEATADRISYDQSSDFLTIEGSTRSDANVWIRDDVQRNFEHVVAVKFSYRLSDKQLRIEKVRNASSIRK